MKVQPGAFQPGAARYVCNVTPVQAGYNIEKAACQEPPFCCLWQLEGGVKQIFYDISYK